MTKHTRDPWVWRRDLNLIWTERGKVVCENIALIHPRGHPEHSEESDANAQLIESAPMLLDVLQQIYRQCPDQFTRDRARVAIEKATEKRP